MARRKTKKRSKNIKPSKPMVTSSMGYSLGDEVFVKMHTPPGLISHGAILEFYPKVPEGPSFLFWDDIDNFWV